MVYNADRNFGICVFLQIWREFTMDEYKKKIIEIIENINDVNILMYLFHFIKGKIKAGE